MVGGLGSEGQVQDQRAGSGVRGQGLESESRGWVGVQVRGQGSEGGIRVRRPGPWVGEGVRVRRAEFRRWGSGSRTGGRVRGRGSEGGVRGGGSGPCLALREQYGPPLGPSAPPPTGGSHGGLAGPGVRGRCAREAAVRRPAARTAPGWRSVPTAPQLHPLLRFAGRPRRLWARLAGRAGGSSDASGE